MDSLVQDRIFRRVGLMDYQGLCSDRDNPYNGAGVRIRPIQSLPLVFKYFFTLITTWMSFLATPVISWPVAYNYEDDEIPIYEDEYDPPEYGQPQDFDDHAAPPEIEKVTLPPNPPRVVAPAPGGPRVVPDPAHARPCDLKTDLYLLQPDRLNSSGQSNPLKVSEALPIDIQLTLLVL